MNKSLEFVIRELDPRHDMDRYNPKSRMLGDIVGSYAMATKHFARGALYGAGVAGVGVATGLISWDSPVQLVRDFAALGLTVDSLQYMARLLYSYCKEGILGPP